MKAIKISSQFGYEIMALNFAKIFDFPVVILPPQTNQEEFDQESEKIFSNMSFFYSRIQKVPFGEKDKFEALAWDIIADFKTGKLDDYLWEKFANSRLEPQTKNQAEFDGLIDNVMNTLFVPQQELLPLDVFSWLKDCPQRLILGQSFHKVNDWPVVEKLAKYFNLYVPGLTESEHVLGIQDVKYQDLYNIYYWADASVGVAGAYTWILLTMFPNTTQIILYNMKDEENWRAIAAAYQSAGYNIHCIGFDEKTNMKELSAKMEEIYKTFF